MKELVVIDVETTALEPKKGEIIEVAAIRYDITTKREIGRFVRLCKPSRPISFETTSITGITNEMVADSEPFSAVVEELADFIGDSLLLAHNASFDRSWLTYHGLNVAKCTWFDSFSLASIAWPEAESYNLLSLVQQYGEMVVTTKKRSTTVQQRDEPHSAEASLLRARLRKGTARGEHSAAFDCEMTWRLFVRLQDELMVSAEAKGQITIALEKAQLNHYIDLFTIDSDHSPVGKKRVEDLEKVVPARTLADLGDIFSKTGLLQQHLPGYQYRVQQEEMAGIVAAAIAAEEKALIEAPTGTGKTFAYLVPSLMAARNGKRVLISTHTKHLQDQLIDEDIPRLNRFLGLDVRYTSLKGRRNYICQQRLLQLLGRPRLKEEDSLLLAKMLVWLDQGGSGDLTRLSLTHQRSDLLWYIHADATSCRLMCDKEGPCPYQRARRAAEQAQLVVVNHALLTRMTTGSEKSLGADVIIADEAHQLESAARGATAISLADIRLRELLAPVLQAAQAHADQTRERHLIAETTSLVTQYRELIDAVGVFMRQHTQRGELRLSTGLRRSATWTKVAALANQWDGRLKFIIGLTESLAGSPSPASPEEIKVARIVADAVRELTVFGQEVHRFFAGDEDRIQWVEVREMHTTGHRAGEALRPEIILHDVALSVASTLSSLLQTTPTVVMTSATIAVGGTFDYIKQRLGFQPDREIVLSSPFSLELAMGIFVATDTPAPGTPPYDRYIAQVVGDVSTLLGGRTLVLVTSRSAVLALYRLLNRMLNKATIKLYGQDINGGRANLVRRFRRENRSVLVGTDSFWEGIDIPGASLSCVIIPKLPFANPYDPVIEAVAEAEGLNAFSDLTVPRMILKLRQGIGRLIRSDQDRGAVIILDARIHSATYGDAVMNSLPTGSIMVGSSAGILEMLTDFFGAETLEQWRDN